MGRDLRKNLNVYALERGRFSVHWIRVVKVRTFRPVPYIIQRLQFPAFWSMWAKPEPGTFEEFVILYGLEINLRPILRYLYIYVIYT